MTKKELTTEQVNNLKAILHKGVSVWLERNNINTKRVKEYYGVSQSKLGIDFHCNFVIENKKKDE